MSRPRWRPIVSRATAAVALALLAGCGLHGSGSNGGACDSIRAEVANVQSQLQQESDLGQLAQQITASAGKVRQEGQAAGGDVASAAEKVAANLDELARYSRDLAAGQAGQPDLSELDASAESFRKACRGGLHG